MAPPTFTAITVATRTPEFSILETGILMNDPEKVRERMTRTLAHENPSLANTRPIIDRRKRRMRTKSTPVSSTIAREG